MLNETILLQVQNVRKSYPEFTLSDVSLELPEGYIMGLIGPNGSGKTTLIRLILHLLHRDGGDIQVFGLDNIRHERAIKQRLGVVFDNTYFLEDWRIADVEPTLKPFYDHWDHDQYVHLLERFGLSPTKKIKELSRGQKTKLTLATALVHNARLLILDEPTSGLDPVSRVEMLDILQGYVEDGKHSVLFSTHITSDLERVADFITYLHKGKLAFSGSKEDFLLSFRIVRGDNLLLLPEHHLKCIGIRQHSSGFEALIHTQDEPMFASFLCERPSIEEIMVYTAKEGDVS